MQPLDMMVDGQGGRLAILLLILFWVVSSVFSSHFRGGIFMIRPKPGGADREVRLSLHVCMLYSYYNRKCSYVQVYLLYYNQSIGCQAVLERNMQLHKMHSCNLAPVI